MARYFAKISEDMLEKKVNAIMRGDGTDAETHISRLIDALGSDIKVKFDLENVCDAAELAVDKIHGLHTLDDGLTFWGFSAGGDWENNVYFIAYWDGKKVRGYVPTDGNVWNTDTKRAYGNDDVADLKNARKRWPNLFDKLITAKNFDNFDIELDGTLLLADIRARILPQPDAKPTPKAPAKRSQASKTAPQTADRRVEVKIPHPRDRITALTYYGTGDEAYELFASTCRLAYELWGMGEETKALIAVAWAEEMAEGSRLWKERHGVTDEAKGVWG